MSLVFYKQKDGTKPAGKFINSLKTDKKELDKALGFMNDYLERREKDE